MKLFHYFSAALIGFLPLMSHAGVASTFDQIDIVTIKSEAEAIAPAEAYIYARSGQWSSGNPHNCTTPYPYTYSIATPVGQLLHSSVLHAKSRGAQVRVYIDGCLSGKPQVTRIDLR